MKKARLAPDKGHPFFVARESGAVGDQSRELKTGLVYQTTAGHVSSQPIRHAPPARLCAECAVRLVKKAPPLADAPRQVSEPEPRGAWHKDRSFLALCVFGVLLGCALFAAIAYSDNQLDRCRTACVDAPGVVVGGACWCATAFRPPGF